MIYKIYNTTEANVTVGGVVFRTEEFTVLINTDDEDNLILTNGIKLADSLSSDVGVYVTKGDFVFYEDDEAQDITEFYKIATEWTEMLAGYEISFYDDGTGRYFDLESKKLNIYNPITETWEFDYATTAVDELSEIVAANTYENVNYATLVYVCWSEFKLSTLDPIFKSEWYENVGSYKFKVRVSSAGDNPNNVDDMYYVNLTVFSIDTDSCNVAIEVTPSNSSLQCPYWTGDVPKSKNSVWVWWEYRTSYDDLTTALALKANTTDVDTALALKSDNHEVIVTNTPVDTGNVWAIMSIPHSTFTQTFGGVFFFETYSSSSGTQVAGALAIHYCNDTDTVLINSMYGSTPYYIDDGSTVTVYINCGSDDVKLRWTSPTAGDMADGRVSMDWIIATPTVYTGSGMSLSTAGTLD